MVARSFMVSAHIALCIFLLIIGTGCPFCLRRKIVKLTVPCANFDPLLSWSSSHVIYPDTMELFENLGVDRVLSDLSFLEIIKFKNDASAYIEELESNPDINRNETLERYIQSRGYSELFQKAFLIPTCASIWSCSSEVMSFSAYSILSFLHNDPTLQLVGHPQTLTPRWCSQSYVDRVKKELESRGCHIRTNSEVYSVLTNDEGCAVISKDGLEEIYDGCIIAVHAPDALKMLGKQATYDESRILGAFQYSYSDLFLHHDNNLMPKNPAVWSSRNFLGTLKNKAYITYWLNNLQNIGESAPFFLTLNPPKTPKLTLFKWSTSQPIHQLLHQKLYISSMLSKEREDCGSVEHTKAGIVAANGLLRKSYTVQKHSKHLVPSSLESGARLLVTRFLERFITTGCLTKKSTLKVTLRVHKPAFYWKVATKADLGFADAYIDGDVSFIDKNEGLLKFFQFTALADEKYDEFTRSAGFIKEYIFPGSWLPSLSRLTSAMATASRFSKILALGFDEKFMRTWIYYFDYCGAGLKYGVMGNYQVVFTRPGDIAAFGNKPYNPVPGDY
ncbi:UNVERIFIED_CONTAM: hypothetical protein Slati_1034400 [Sesamum latifolium]|uniref:Amine oxidase domain-containing protein n=1 Tax=Sesamum latifolium TaxID=2727402 RepID=A0AAW2XSG5_9LAMI